MGRGITGIIATDPKNNEFIYKLTYTNSNDAYDLKDETWIMSKDISEYDVKVSTNDKSLTEFVNHFYKKGNLLVRRLDRMYIDTTTEFIRPNDLYGDCELDYLFAFFKQNNALSLITTPCKLPIEHVKIGYNNKGECKVPLIFTMNKYNGNVKYEPVNLI